MSGRGHGDRGDPGQQAAARTGTGGDRQGQASPPPPKPGTHRRRPADPGEERWVEGREPRPRQPEPGGECFLAHHHLAVSPHGARSSGWKGGGARPTRRFQEPPLASPSGAVQSAPSAGRAPHPHSPRALLSAYSGWLTPSLPQPSFFFFSPLPPPPILPSSLSGYELQLTPDAPLAGGRGCAGSSPKNP